MDWPFILMEPVFRATTKNSLVSLVQRTLCKTNIGNKLCLLESFSLSIDMAANMSIADINQCANWEQGSTFHKPYRRIQA
jgi:hypothetical protein